LNLMYLKLLLLHLSQMYQSHQNLRLHQKNLMFR